MTWKIITIDAPPSVIPDEYEAIELNMFDDNDDFYNDVFTPSWYSREPVIEEESY